MKATRRDRKETRDATVNIGLVFSLILLQSWIADGIQGGALFTWTSHGLSFADSPWLMIAVLAMLLVSGFGLAWMLYTRRRTFLPIQIQRIGEPDDVTAHAVLVLTMSFTGAWKIDITNKQLTHPRGDPVDLSGDLNVVLDRLAALGERFSWEQILRAIAKHTEKLQRVVLIGSPGENGTARRFEECRDFLLPYFQLPKTSFEKKEADFEKLDDLVHVYQTVIRDQAQRKREIMIDVTGGTKVVSIAAAMVTLEHPEIEFQYVETHHEKRIRTFNVSGSGIETGSGA